MANLADLSNATTTAIGLSNLILVTPEDTGYQPQNPSTVDGEDYVQPPGFLFDYEGEQTVNLQSDITDHFAEDNKALQDQIALRPVIATTRGYIGELNDVAPAALKPLQRMAQKLTVISAYQPSLSVTALIAYNNALALYQAQANLRRNAVAAWGSINGTNRASVIDDEGLTAGNNQNKQQVAFQTFYGYWQARTLFTIQTPWALFKNMAIMNLRAIQGEDTRVITDFEVTFKQMRFADTLETFAPTGNEFIYDKNQFQGRSFNQGAPQVDLGTSTPVDDGTTLNSAFGIG